MCQRSRIVHPLTILVQVVDIQGHCPVYKVGDGFHIVDGYRLVLYDQRVDLREGEPIPVKGDGEEVPFASDGPLRLECQAFLPAIKTRRSPLTDGTSGLRVLKVLQAAQRSLVMNGEPIALPMEAFA
jgi:predicted dehydrogenase